MKRILLESPCFNKKCVGKTVFPINKVRVIIHTNDHEPPHFHVEYDGWDVCFYIENGEEYRTKRRGKNSKSYDYIVKNSKIWLCEQCGENNKITNKEYLLTQWDVFHNNTLSNN